MLTRLWNGVAKAIKENILLPKMMVIVPDDDIIKLIQHDGPEFVKSAGRILNSIMKDHEKLISIQKDHLPRRSRRHMYPQIIWIEPPVHINFSNNLLREQFNNKLNDVASYYENVSVLQLKKVWDPDNGNLYLADSAHFTSEGLNANWRAIDATVRYADTILVKRILAKTAGSKAKKPKSFDKKDKFHWRRSEDTSHTKFSDDAGRNPSGGRATGYQLPKPPGYKSR